MKLGIRFIKAALLYFVVGTTMGAFMSIEQIYMFVVNSQMFERAHAHINLIGWVSLSLIGFTYFMIEQGRPLYSQKLGNIGFWLINIGIFFEFVFLIIGGYVQASYAMKGIEMMPYTGLIEIFAFVMLAGFYISIYNILKTLS